MDKSPDAFRTISEVADVLDTPAHVLRFWESRFPQIRPVKRAGGRRYYRPSDVALLTGIKRLLHDEGLTIRGVQKMLRDQGVRHVAGLSDDSVALDELLAADEAPALTEAGSDPDRDEGMTEDVQLDAILSDDDLAGAATIAADDVARPAPSPGRETPIQSVLPLFEAVAPKADLAPRKPLPRDNVTIARLVRASPRGSLAGSQLQVADLARRLAALRALMVQRAEGGQG
jgi:DNA-binding transcriptional MerR regulator